MVQRRAAGLILCVLLLGAPATAGSDDRAAPDERAARAFKSYRTAVERALIRGEPAMRRFFTAVRAAEDRHRVTWHRAIGDLNGDGSRDVLVERWRFTVDPVGFGLTGDYRAQVLGGDRGTLLWSYRNEYSGGFPVLAFKIRLGGGAPGLLFPKIDNQSAESPTYRLTLQAIDGYGRGVWQRAFTSTFSWFTGDVAGTDVPFAFQKFDPDGDAATDFLVALTDYVKAAVPDRAVARSEIFTLDARDGSLVFRGSAGPDVYWFHSIQAGPDIDGEGGDDVVIAGEENSPDSYLEARSGLTGETIWREETHLGWNPWAHAVPDMSSDGEKDLIVGWTRPRTNKRLFQIWDARRARPLWKQEGTFPYLLGDVDEDGAADIGAYEFVHTRKRSGARFMAFSRGLLLYKASYVHKLPECQGFCFSFGFYLDAGDIDGDRLRDTYVLSTHPSKGKPKRVEYAVAGADGGLLYRERNLVPVLGSIDGGRGDDLVGFTRSEEDVVTISAYDGITRRTLLSRPYEMTGAHNLGAFGAYDAAVDLDGDGNSELLVKLSGKGAETLMALDGATGNILWQRPVTGNAKVLAP